ncbi:hypothetical protein QA601_04465 [Chitinispirillales bacterium ANBcel5]|uniref:hypothetical protein n=1 Tax=Cellulosispirillum alkaliphilum TaxID=3039283 RepID=UPI002A568CD6|nr:hypothetical protein [Chitinispirillales bacterium ANBcel5]
MIKRYVISILFLFVLSGSVSAELTVDTLASNNIESENKQVSENQARKEQNITRSARVIEPNRETRTNWSKIKDLFR